MTKPSILFIAHLSGSDTGGDISLIELIKDAKKRCHKLHVVVSQKGDFSATMENLNIPWTEVNYTWWGGQFHTKEAAPINLQSIGRIAGLIKEHNLDVVATNTSTIPWGALAASITDKPHIWMVREFPVNQLSELEDKYDFIDSFSNIVLANSKYLTSHLRKKGIKKVETFYSFVDTTDLKLNPHIKEPQIINIGQIHAGKNQLDILKAADILKKQNKLGSIQVVFIGRYDDSSDYFKKLQAFIREHGLTTNVKFTNGQTDPYQHVGPNDIFIQPSVSESLGRTITEAMKLGLICIGADIEGTSEAFELGGGILYKSQDPSDLAAKIKLVLDDPVTYQKSARQYQIQALDNMSQEACHRPFFGAVKKMANQPNPRRELRHLLDNFSDNAEEFKLMVSSLEGYKRDLDNILESRAWKTILKLRKVMGK